MKGALILWLFFCNIAFSQSKTETITVYFESNSFELSKKEETKLISFFSNSSIVVSSVVIEGFCDDVDSFDYNNVLSQKRGNSVADYLKNKHQINNLKVSGKGEIGLASGSKKNIIKTRANNRKATVVIEYSIPEKNIEMETAESVTKVDSVATVYKTIDAVLEVNDKIIIENLIFRGSRTTFEDGRVAEKELQKIIAYLQKNPAIKFEIHGHVCCISASFKDARDKDTGLNNLSESRAKRIYDYFLANGIAKERMIYKGFGRQFPRMNVHESQNKRVEIVIVKI